MKKFYVTTPIYYLNSVPHIGHAYTTLAADIINRYKKQKGEESYFLTGTDEHGANIEKSAANAGVTPQQWTDNMFAKFKEMWTDLDIKYDDFIRTTEPRNEVVVQAIFEKLLKTGDIYKGSYNKGKFNGIGTYIWENGTIYQGEWKENTMSGYGIIKYINNNNNNNNINNYYYEGEIKNGYMNGLGYFYFNGNKYIGNYIKDLKEGFGIFVWNEIPLKAYVGFWEKGKQNGLGVNINGNSYKYGIWKKGKKEIWLNNEKEIKKIIKLNKYEKCFKNPIRYVNKILKIIDDY